jgi:peroxiredoxin
MAVSGQQNGIRDWTVKTEKGSAPIKARVVSIAKGNVLLEDSAGKQHTVPLSGLPDDQRKEALIRAIGSGVVMVHPKSVFDEPMGFGSGFVIYQGGVILTNYHVIRGAGSIEVEFRDQKEKIKAECLGVDRGADIAILKVDKVPAGVQVIELSIQALPKQGDAVWTIGHPGGLNNTVSWGDVNAVRKTTELPERLRTLLAAPDGITWIQTDAVLSQGSSGGPLLNHLGQAIGMNTFITGPQLGFAVHVLHARETFYLAVSPQAKQLTLPLPPGDKESAIAWLSRDVAPLIKSYAQDMKAMEASAAGATQEQLLQKIQQVTGKYRPQLLNVARRDPAGWPALQALYYVCDLSVGDSPAVREHLGEACKLLLAHHASSRDLGALIPTLAGVADENAKRLCDHVLSASPHQDVKAQAALALGIHRLKWLTESGGMDEVETKAARDAIAKFAASLEGEFGKVMLGEYSGKQHAEQLSALLAATHVGRTAAEITGIDATGTRFNLSDYRGKVVVLDFFADWCPWCRKMYPQERKLVEQYKERPFALLGVNTDNQKVLTTLVENQTVTWRTWADGEQGPIAAAWQIADYPNLFLIDHKGNVRRHFAGTPSEEELQAAIESLVKQAEAKL